MQPKLVDSDKAKSSTETAKQQASTTSSKPKPKVAVASTEEFPSMKPSPSNEEMSLNSTLKLHSTPISIQKKVIVDDSLQAQKPPDPDVEALPSPQTNVSKDPVTMTEAKPACSRLVTRKGDEVESQTTTTTPSDTPHIVEEAIASSNAKANKGSLAENPPVTTLDKSPTAQVVVSSTPPSSSSSWMSAPSSVSLQDMMRVLEQATGVEEIAALKKSVVQASDRLDAATLRVQEMRQQLDENAVKAQEISAQHAAMMQNRSSWNEQDVQAFAQLTAAEGKARQLASTSRQAVRQAEDEMQKSLRNYMDALRRRYHEEQLWQDKWRVLGTYWTWSLIALNSVVFVVGQALHYRREERRLLSIEEMFREYAARAETSAAALVSQKSATEATKPGVDAEAKANDDKETYKSKSKKHGAEKRKRSKAINKQQETDKESAININLRDQWRDWTRSTSVLLQASGRFVQHHVVLCTNATMQGTATGLEASQRAIQRLWDGTVHATRSGTNKLVKASQAGAVATMQTADDVWKNKRVQKMWTRREELMKQIHWPSLAAGAVTASLGLFLLSSNRPK